MRRFLAILCAVCLVLSLGSMAFASAEPAAASSEPTAAAGGASGGMMAPPPGGGSSEPDSYDAVLDVTASQTISGVTMSSSNGDENVIHVMNGANVLVNDSIFTNTGSGSAGDASSFYGVGATLFVSDGNLYSTGNIIATDTTGGAGVFAYDNGTAYVYNDNIVTKKGSSGGIHVAGGGTLYAWDCNVQTNAGSAAAIRSDRGGGKMVIDGGSYVSNVGTGAIYCTADITVHDAYLYSGQSEALAIEGKNTIRLFDCDLTGNMQPIAINDNRVWNCIVYQSMSGDAEVGTSELDMIGGDLTCHAGPVIFNTNTSSYITFKDVDIHYGPNTTYFLQVTGNASTRTWGTAGKNGANCVFSAYDQDVDGQVLYDTISNLDFYLLDDSEMEGFFTCDDSYNGGYSGTGVANVYIDRNSSWEVTGDSVITGTLYCAGEIEDATIVDMQGNVLWGSGPYTVTVGALAGTVDASGAGQVPAWQDYAVANPFLQ